MVRVTSIALSRASVKKEYRLRFARRTAGTTSEWGQQACTAKAHARARIATRLLQVRDAAILHVLQEAMSLMTSGVEFGVALLATRLLHVQDVASIVATIYDCLMNLATKINALVLLPGQGT